MVKEWLRVLTLGSVGLFALSAVAQNIAGNQPCECVPSSVTLPCDVTNTVWYIKKDGHFDPAKQDRKLSKLLKLSTEQQSQVLDVLKSAKAQLEALRSAPSLSRRVRKCRVALVRQASNDRIRELLDKKQDAKLVWMQTPPTFSRVEDFHRTTQ